MTHADSSTAPSHPGTPPPGRSDRLSLVFACAVFLSAFLLFQIQPLISRLLLPWFGGSPGVWTTCMLFFQLLLFLGYTYSHLSTSRLSLSQQTLLHAFLLTATVLPLQILPDPSWKPTDGSAPVPRILAVLSITVGLPYFLLSTTGPLLLRWYSLLRPRSSPHRLYALSNSGSLLALLSYPLLIEPALSLPGQARFWTVGFVVFAGLCAATMWSVRRSHSHRIPAAAATTVSPGPTGTDVQLPELPGRAKRLQWFGLACLASVMLTAETNQICQDIAVVPFLWIVPLALYLLSFILCFESERWYVRRWFGPVSAVLLLALCWVQAFGLRLHLSLQLLVWCSTLFAVFMLCHGELARLRPTAQSLTLFYLILSAGGACGGVINALIAPVVFPGYWEHHIGILLSAMLALLVWFDQRSWLTRTTRPPLPAVATAILLIVAVLTVSASAMIDDTSAIATRRNFYGVLEVEDFPAEDAVILKHGRIVHGLQFRGMPAVPTMYYGYQTGVARALTVLRERRASVQGQLRIGLVGLGVGTLAAYGQPNDFLEFYEINRHVIELAREHFTFLKQCRSTVEIVEGDARLSLENLPPRNLDLLVLDAFSGDAIPTHLLTADAFQAFLRHLSPDGIIAVHISNIHFDLQRVTDGVAKTLNLASLTIDTSAETESDTGLPLVSSPGSRWVLLATTPEPLNHALLRQNAVPSKPETAVFWTDNYSNLIQILGP